MAQLNVIEDPVILTGSNGSVTVSKALLDNASDKCHNMFMQRDRKRIVMKDFDRETLTGFSVFLNSGNLGKETVLELIEVGREYRIWELKKAAEVFVKDNIHDIDEEKIVDFFYKNERRTLFDTMKRFGSYGQVIAELKNRLLEWF